MSRRTILAIAAAILGALVLFAPAGAVAHSGHGHMVAPKNAAVPVAAKDNATTQVRPVRAELRAQNPASATHDTDTICADRGCCGSGHCTGSGNALAPAAWAGFGPPASVRLFDPDSTPPSALAREGPPRPPKSIA
jgi:hypothetical protein